MGLIQTKDQPLFIGVDGGGSKCRATIYSVDGNVLGTGVAGRANPLHGLAQTFESIEESTRLALLDAGMKESDSRLLVAGLGLAGVNVPRLYQDVVNWQHPFAAMYVTTDLHTACIGAHRGADGAVIITGTGSCGYSHVDDTSLSIGGYGFALGDKGSGAWLGLKAAEHVLLALDGFAVSTSLTDMLLNYFNVTDALGIVENLAGKSSSCYAALARNVLDCANDGDAVAIAIVQEGADYISEMARKLFSLNPVRFSMIGGLAEPLQAWLSADVVAKISETLAPPEFGAMYFAQQEFNKSLSV
ncbi:N-acetylglucosamine kinase [Shewanella glacialipiscicola]|uniref:ATPase n=1 Tax=Shewanella glacialipiscicola TaxID=614069 RepID=A0ABQ6J4K8_9GAMM|nr:BadF/BadG/BcrA/BcrD ATPase family protein [Shewanella glacialipiscicola]MCL1087823.1 ATPase [Shewanella glacialipiscicola]GIU12104.1 ATPase [Shewanella glacialipiscicola]GMA83025.1 ATPase [Shewanella glacialipiscicola]